MIPSCNVSKIQVIFCHTKSNNNQPFQRVCVLWFEMTQIINHFVICNNPTYFIRFLITCMRNLFIFDTSPFSLYNGQTLCTHGYKCHLHTCTTQYIDFCNGFVCLKWIVVILLLLGNYIVPHHTAKYIMPHYLQIILRIHTCNRF